MRFDLTSCPHFNLEPCLEHLPNTISRVVCSCRGSRSGDNLEGEGAGELVLKGDSWVCGCGKKIFKLSLENQVKCIMQQLIETAKVGRIFIIGLSNLLRSFPFPATQSLYYLYTNLTNQETNKHNKQTRICIPYFNFEGSMASFCREHTQCLLWTTYTKHYKTDWILFQPTVLFFVRKNSLWINTALYYKCSKTSSTQKRMKMFEYIPQWWTIR